METIKTNVKDLSVNNPCTVSNGYRVVIYDIYDNVVSVDDYKSLDFAMLFTGFLVHQLRSRKNILAIKEEVYYIKKSCLVGLKKTYNF